MYFNLCWPNSSLASEDKKCISSSVDQTPPMPAKTQNDSLHVLTKHIPCQGGHKMHFNMCWPTHPRPASTQIAYQENPTHASKDNLCWPNPSHFSEDTKYISTCVDQNQPHPREDTILILTCVEQSPLLLARTHKIYLNLCWPKPIPSQGEHNFYLNMCWPNSSNARWYIKCISTRYDQTHPMPARTLKVSHLVLIKPIPCQRGENCISICVDQAPPVPAST
jgi:hypothetical protein